MSKTALINHGIFFYANDTLQISAWCCHASRRHRLSVMVNNLPRKRVYIYKDSQNLSNDLEISSKSLFTIRMYNALHAIFHFLFVYVNSNVFDKVKGLFTGTWKNLKLYFWQWMQHLLQFWVWLARTCEMHLTKTCTVLQWPLKVSDVSFLIWWKMR